LGVDPFVIADVCCIIEIEAQTFASENNTIKMICFQEHDSIFQQAVIFLIANGILSEFKPRLKAIQKKHYF
jgi:hypothetical protein